MRLHPKINMSQESFGKSLGVTGAAISRIESGTRNASDQIVLGICRRFNISERWLRTGAGDMFAQQDRESEIAQMVQSLLSMETSDFKARFISVLSGLRDEQWLVLEEKMREIIGSRLDAPAIPAPAPGHEEEATPPVYPPDEPDKETTDPKIEAEVDAIRRQLYLEKEAAERSSASTESAANVEKLA